MFGASSGSVFGGGSGGGASFGGVAASGGGGGIFGSNSNNNAPTGRCYSWSCVLSFFLFSCASSLGRNNIIKSNNQLTN